MLQIKSHQFQVTEAMQEVATQRFNFLNPEELNHLRLKIETLNPHRLRIKAIYQKSKQKPFVMEVLTSDFYQGIEQLSKKMKTTLRRQDEKLRRRQHKISLGLALSEIEAMEQEALQSQIQEVEVPIYQLTQIEAVKQLDLFDDRVLMYYDIDLELICTLVKQEEGVIKQYIGIH